MIEAQFFEAFRQFCADNKIELRYKFHVGKSIAIVVLGEKCIEPLDNWLNANTKSHTTPTSHDDGIMSYVTL